MDAEENRAAVIGEAQPAQAVAVVSPGGFGLVTRESVAISGSSPWRQIWHKLRRNRTAMAGLYILAVMYSMAILAGFIAPYSYETQQDHYGFYPP
ncbi:MAG TPA: hypothetical protein VI756_17920, partial [Blastocatellia bacterium]